MFLVIIVICLFNIVNVIIFLLIVNRLLHSRFPLQGPVTHAVATVCCNNLQLKSLPLAILHVDPTIKHIYYIRAEHSGPDLFPQTRPLMAPGTVFCLISGPVWKKVVTGSICNLRSLANDQLPFLIF